MTPERVDDWPERLDAYLRAARRRAFSRGRHDCVTFVAGWCREATGVDPARGLGLRYRTVEGAVSTLRRLGGTLEDAAAARLAECGFPEIDPGRARRGDVVFLRAADPGEPDGLAIVGGDGFLYTPALPASCSEAVGREKITGLNRLPRANAVRAWSIG